MKSERDTVAKIESNYVKQYDAQVSRQKNRQKRLVRRLALFAVLTFVIMGGLLSYHIHQRSLHAEKKADYEELKTEHNQLEQKQANLEEEIQLLKDEDYVLQIARTNYFFSKEGEIIFKLPDSDPSY
ncbi:cell division protein [Pontibacillus halophilus JSM 076056 = DSM 19796]|uniref:Cell division protein n=1 Tax=Pontibacillus halophilus JSM 076056 = DSM 19796 TaxID=1385510 RepID=A0A0A5I2K2_9BACI|nr:septum formation initiator family protein [Pontibacillus halophilus]KGX90072.1 cell division protein [Pontibacillus halophilus JSM 076056 = DSM 19796]